MPESLEDLRLDLLTADCVAAARKHWPGITFADDLRPVTVPGAPARLVRAVTNLLDNAAKFSPPGGTVSVTVAANRISVRDNGPGIPPDDLPHVFDRFYRSSAARTTPGHGLGPAIAAQVAALHGASPVIESSPGSTVVTLLFPSDDQV
ncbi:sensor histidine kinase [Nocardia sp. NPDC005825]|uniref:sensor histidine kinase n=1 Tax=unclassified Nocardia TaxID=2637762 RepID=UPI0033EEA338